MEKKKNSGFLIRPKLILKQIFWGKKNILSVSSTQSGEEVDMESSHRTVVSLFDC